MTPRAAIENGADYLVIGRPVTRAADPLKALEQINREIEQG
jgi:orotidine-5'-phosphate decarboxylase